MGDALLTWEQIFRVAGIATLFLIAMMTTIVVFTWMFLRQAEHLERSNKELMRMIKCRRD